MAFLAAAMGPDGECRPKEGNQSHPPEDEEARLRRELAEVRGHQERLAAAAKKRARKAAKRIAHNAELRGRPLADGPA